MSVAAGAGGAEPSRPGPCAFALWLAAALGAGASIPLGLPLLERKAVPDGLPHAPPRFALTASDGTIVTERTLAGAPYMLVFGYTRCGAQCGERLARVLGWRTRIGGAAHAVRVVFVSVDPDHDTPARMAAFAARAPGPVLALTGTSQAVARAAAGFNAFAFRAALCSGGTSVAHSGAAYLVGSDGLLRASISEGESDASALAKLRRLAAD